jgi:hypothetical protein
LKFGLFIQLLVCSPFAFADLVPKTPVFNRPRQIPTSEQLSTCPSRTSLNVVSINVGFEYEGPGDLFRGAVNDVNYFSELAKSFTPSRNIFRFGNTLVRGANPKEQFLRALRDSVQGKEFVNLNYAGHGLRLPNGEFAMVLPSLPDRWIEACLITPSTRKEDFRLRPREEGLEPRKESLEINSDSRRRLKESPDCSVVEKHIVRDRELREVLGDRKVFGLIDACYSGSMELGPQSAEHRKM